MNKVVTVSLNANAYQLDEDGYALLCDYLGGARARLGGNPDLEEIMSDLEQAIADKLHRFLRPGKTVVSGGEIERVLDEMGPVDSPTEAPEAPRDDAGESEPGGPAQPDTRPRWPRRPRKLYRLTGDDEKMIAGVCAGIAAYSGIDVSIVRIVLIALMFATSGILVLGYLLLIPVVPEAKTPEEQAAAYGVPFDARGVIDQAKSRFSGIGEGKGSPRSERRRGRYVRGAGFDGAGSLLGFAVLSLGVLVGVYVLIGLVRWSTPMWIGSPGPTMLHSPPWWNLALLLLLGAVVLGSVMRSGQDRPPLLVSLLSTTVQLLLLLFVIWLAYRAFPFVREVVDGTMIALYRVFH